MNILILGGNRFVGKALANELINRGDDVTLFNRKGTGVAECNIVKGDRNSIEDLKKINFSEYDQIVDMCLYKPEQFVLLEPLLNPEVPYTCISSCAAFADTNIWPINESHRLGGMKAYGNYGTEKAQVEYLIAKSTINCTILRPTYIDGVGNHSPRIGHYIRAIQDGTTIDVAGNGHNIINLVYVEDVVKSIINTFGLFKSNSYIVGSDEFLTVNSLIEIIAEFLKVEDVHRVYNSQQAILPENHYGIFDNSKIKIEFTQSFNTLKEILPTYMEWVNSQSK